MHYRAICFDFDYTLADATDSIVAGFQHALTSMGYPEPQREPIRRTIGYLLEDGYTVLTGDNTKEGRARFRELYLEVALPIQLRGIPLFPGAQELLRGLKAKGVKVGIVSSRRLPAIQSTMEQEGLLDALEFIIGGEHVTKPKPDPQGLLEAMRVLRNVEGIGICELTNADVVRHVMVQRIVEAYEKYENAKNGGKGKK